MNANGIFVISLDFELQYGVEDKKNVVEYKKNIIGGRGSIEKMLKLFEKYDVHVTWATLGMILANDKEDLEKYLPIKKPKYANEKLSSYSYMDFIGNNEEDDPYHYGYSLGKIISTYPNQEIASHTFSHYYSNEEGQTDEDFKSDMMLSKKIIKDKLNFDAVSLVLPRNQINEKYIKIVSDLGFTSYRGGNKLFNNNLFSESLPIRILRLIDIYLGISKQTYKLSEVIEENIYNIKSSTFFRPYNPKIKFLENLKISTMKRKMSNAAKNNEVYHIWWHPHNFGLNQEQNLNQLEELLKHYKFLNKKYGLKSLTMGEISKELSR